MAHIERKVFYVGTWREDKVTDGTMRQIITRSLVEKGQKVKVKLSQNGLLLSKTVLFQENLVSSQALQDVYFMTVNQRHPCCLLCIVADPVRRYLILALRTANPVEAQEIISTFKALKDNPTIDSGNVVLRRKDNGNWTLRERSQVNANRHLQEVFKDELGPDLQPSPANGSAGGGYAPVIDGSKAANRRSENHYRLAVPDGGIVVHDPDDGEECVVIVAPDKEVDELSQELQDVKFVVEKSGSVIPATLHRNTSRRSNNSTVPHIYINNNNDEDPEKYYIETEVTTTYPEPLLNGEVIQVHSNGGHDDDDDKPGKVRAVVQDHRDQDYGVVRAHSNGSALPDKPVFVHNNGHQEPTRPASATTTTLVAGGEYRDDVVHRRPKAAPPNGYSDIPDYRINRRVSTEYVAVPDFTGRKVLQAGSLRSNATTTAVPATRVSFDPEVVRRGSHDPRQFRSLRTSRYVAAPTTIVRPIEQVYGHGRPTVLRRHGGGGGMYVVPATYVVTPDGGIPPPSQAPAGGKVLYVPPGSSGSMTHHPAQSHRRRPRPSSIHVMEGNSLKVFHKTGEADDILL